MRSEHPTKRSGPDTATTSTKRRGLDRRLVVALSLVLALLASLTGPTAADTRGGEVDPNPLGTPVRGEQIPVRGKRPPVHRPAEQPINLELVPGANTVLELGGPVVIPSTDPPPEPGEQLVGNEFGCAATCITEALLHKNPFDPDIELAMTTNVNTTKYLWVLPPTAYLVNGLPVHLGLPPTAQDAPDHTWNHDIQGLVHGSAYRIVIMAIDNQGNSETASTLVATTPAPLDTLVGNGSGCYYDCIDVGTVVPGDTFDVATLELQANTDVTFDVAVSTSPPFEVNGNLGMVNQINMDIANQTSDSLTGQLTGLAADTTYHVLAVATDLNGFVHYAVGSFHTDDEPVEAPGPSNVTVNFEKFDVKENGDLVGNGEIRFTMGLGPNGESTYWRTEEQKVADNGVVIAGFESTIQVEEDAFLPDIIVNAIERDVMFPSPVNSCGNAPVLYTSAAVPECADGSLSITAGVLTHVSIGWIETLPDCGDEVPGVRANRKCVDILSGGMNGNDFVEFTALVSFEIN